MRCGLIRLSSEVADFLSYDTSEIDDNTVDNLSTREILLRAKGVCQHYSNLYVAMARAMGIPARMVEGFIITEKGLVGHSWVEVKVSDTVWWPLDPQVAGAVQLPSRKYLPVSVDHSYEAISTDPSVRASIILGGTWLDIKYADATVQNLP